MLGALGFEKQIFCPLCSIPHWESHHPSEIPYGPTNPHKGELGVSLGEESECLSLHSECRDRVSVCPYLRRLSLGHPSLGAARLDHTGGTAGDQWRTVLVGPW